MEHTENTPHRWYQFRLRTVLFVMLLIAVLLSWWSDHRRLEREARMAQVRLDEMVHVGGFMSASVGSVPAKRPSLEISPEDFVARLRSIQDWYEFTDRTADPFVESTRADEAIPLLIEVLKDPKPEYRFRAACTLEKLGRVAGSSEVRSQRAERIVPALIPLLTDPHPNVRWHAASALSSFAAESEAVLPALRQQRQDSESPIAALATTLVHDAEQNGFETRLIALLSSPAKANREQAVQALGKLDTPRAVAALQEAYDRERDPAVQDAIVRVLAARRSKFSW